jgi:hypothetical protein
LQRKYKAPYICVINLTKNQKPKTKNQIVMNKQQAIEQVNESVGSLFTKSDVLAILDSLENAPASTDSTKSEIIKQMRTKICSVFSQMRMEAEDAKVDVDDAEFDFENGNQVYISNQDDLEVEINGCYVKDWVSQYEDEIESFLEELEEETEEEIEEETEEETEI